MSKKEYNQQYYVNNKDRHREKVRLYYQQNREKVLLRKALVQTFIEQENTLYIKPNGESSTVAN